MMKKKPKPDSFETMFPYSQSVQDYLQFLQGPGAALGMFLGDPHEDPDENEGKDPAEQDESLSQYAKAKGKRAEVEGVIVCGRFYPGVRLKKAKDRNPQESIKKPSRSKRR